MIRKREFDCVNKKCSLEFLKNVCIFQSKQPYLSNVVDFQSSRLRILAWLGGLRRRLKCEKLTDDGRQVMAKSHITFGKVS
jgi:hypothetical protein